MLIGEIEKLVSCVGRLPGMGFRSAMRVVVHLLKRKDTVMNNLIKALVEVFENAMECEVCGNVDVKSTCFVCIDKKRDFSMLCVIADISDLWAIERAGFYRGRYHVLGGKLSAIDGIRPEDLDIARLCRRISDSVNSKDGETTIREVIIAMSSDLDGQTTMFFVRDKLKELNVKTTTLSNGVPIGSDLDGLDDGTLIAAFNHRHGV
jgi:recombination protein RecR